MKPVKIKYDYDDGGDFDGDLLLSVHSPKGEGVFLSQPLTGGGNRYSFMTVGMARRMAAALTVAADAAEADR
jgi:hypothetical protein